MNSVGSPYLCELEEKQLVFYSFKPQSSAWKQSLEKILAIAAEEVTSVELNTRRNFDLMLGIFSAQLIYLTIKIEFRSGETYRLFSKSLAAVGELIKWCEKNEVVLSDPEQMRMIFTDSENPVEVIRENRLTQ